MRRFSTAALALASAASTAAFSHADRTTAATTEPDAARLRVAMAPPSSTSSTTASSASHPGASRDDAPPDMVPITADLLRAHYATFRSPAIHPSLRRAQDALIARREALLSDAPHAASAQQQPRAVPARPDPAAASMDGVDKDEAPPSVHALLAEPVPNGLDNSMYRLRLSCEEAADRLETGGLATRAGAALPTRLRATAGRVASFQQRQTAHVDAVVRGLLPRDFRASLFATARARSERANAAALTGLSLRARYRVLWLQQWRRRELLASVGSANGIWRWAVRYLGGVPEPLLAFARNINSPDGPTEALRDKFGASLTELVRFAVEMNALCAAAALSSRNEGEVAGVLTSALDVYDKEVDAFVELLEEVITNSPFFVRPDELERYRDGAAAGAEGGNAVPATNG